MNMNLRSVCVLFLTKLHRAQDLSWISLDYREFIQIFLEVRLVYQKSLFLKVMMNTFFFCFLCNLEITFINALIFNSSY